MSKNRKRLVRISIICEDCQRTEAVKVVRESVDDRPAGGTMHWLCVACKTFTLHRVLVGSENTL